MSETPTSSPSPTEVPTVFLPALDMREGHVLVGDQGGLSYVYEARPNSLMSGFVTVETEHGYMIFDEDREQTFAVLADEHGQPVRR